jgi:hypothetical protein
MRVLKDLLTDVFWSVLYFPLWWYGPGLRKTLVYSWKKVKAGWRNLALTILLVNFFKPMYGQKGFAAYALSIGTRFFQVLSRLFLVLLWALFWVCILLLWVILPLFSLWQIFLLIFT